MRAARLLTVALVVTLVGGCGSAGLQGSGEELEPGAGGSPSAPATPGTTPTTSTSGASTGGTAPPTDLGPPTLPGPSGAPRTPSDLVPSNIIVGTIRGGTASCYTVETDDGLEYALLGVDDVLAPHDVVRVTIAEDRPDAAPCDGRPVTVVELTFV